MIASQARIVGADPRIVPSERDAAILERNAAARDRIEGPRVGDFVVFADGSRGRFTYDWGNGIQTTVRPKRGGYEFGAGSFYLGPDGVSYSGALDPMIPKAQLADTGETALGAFWFFHRDWACAHSAVYVEAPCRVYREIGPGAEGGEE